MSDDIVHISDGSFEADVLNAPRCVGTGPFVSNPTGGHEECKYDEPATAEHEVEPRHSDRLKEGAAHVEQHVLKSDKGEDGTEEVAVGLAKKGDSLVYANGGDGTWDGTVVLCLLKHGLS